MERVSKEKPSSLLGLVVSDEGKKFYNIDTRTEKNISFYLFSISFFGAILQALLLNSPLLTQWVGGCVSKGFYEASSKNKSGINGRKKQGAYSQHIIFFVTYK
jgi:hypothetical protein